MNQDDRIQNRLWVCHELKRVLGFDEVEGIADHILHNIGDREDLVSYCTEIIGDDSPAFIEQLAKRLFHKQHSKKQHSKHSSGPDPNRGKGMIIRKISSNKSRKQNRNREICDCFGTEHEVFSNCLHCGRIACAAEGEGSCFYCGSRVHKSYPDSIAADAVQKKETLLENQQNMTSSRVIDDQQPDFVAEEQTSEPTLEAMVISFEALHGFANQHLSGQAQQLYDSIRNSIRKKESE